MNDARETWTVPARPVVRPALGWGVVALAASAAFAAGLATGGVVLPYLTAERPDPPAAEGEAAAGEPALLLSLLPQTVLAAPVEGMAPVSTGLSVEQYVSEIEVRAQQAGHSAARQVERVGERVVLSWRFADLGPGARADFPAQRATAPHPKSLSLTFAAGPAPGTVVLAGARVDGAERRAGARFVDLVEAGGVAPELASGQVLTRRGVFEIRLSEGRPGAWLDGRLVYPVEDATAESAAAGAGRPSGPVTRLAIQALIPAGGPFRDKIALAAQRGDGACRGEAAIIDVPRDLVRIVGAPLAGPTARVVAGAGGQLELSGFCAAAAGGPARPDPGLTAIYDPRAGQIRWRRAAPAAVPAAPAAAVPDSPANAVDAATSQDGAWRSQGARRIASPIVPGGVLVSLSCRADGGASLAISGLPGPAGGGASGIVRIGGASGTLAWRAPSAGYELDGRARPDLLRAMLQPLRGAGPVNIAAGGQTRQAPAPGAAAIDRVLTACARPAAPASTPARAPAPAVKSTPAKSTAAPAPPKAPAGRPAPPRPAPPRNGAG